jgi:hypothetical protein
MLVYLKDRTHSCKKKVSLNCYLSRGNPASHVAGRLTYGIDWGLDRHTFQYCCS